MVRRGRHASVITDVLQARKSRLRFTSSVRLRMRRELRTGERWSREALLAHQQSALAALRRDAIVTPLVVARRRHEAQRSRY